MRARVRVYKIRYSLYSLDVLLYIQLRDFMFRCFAVAVSVEIVYARLARIYHIFFLQSLHLFKRFIFKIIKNYSTCNYASLLPGAGTLTTVVNAYVIRDR